MVLLTMNTVYHLQITALTKICELTWCQAREKTFKVTNNCLKPSKKAEKPNFRIPMTYRVQKEIKILTLPKANSYRK